MWIIYVARLNYINLPIVNINSKKISICATYVSLFYLISLKSPRSLVHFSLNNSLTYIKDISDKKNSHSHGKIEIASNGFDRRRRQILDNI